MLLENKKITATSESNEKNPYQYFDFDTFNYIFKNNVKWLKAGSGEYQADSFTNKYAIRGQKGSMSAACLPGGPGSTLTSSYKTYFNKNDFKVIVSDWRGVGTSMPNGKLEDNTTDGLLDDIEKMRKINEQEKILLRGGSWGATMALKYAQTYPEKVSGLVIGLPFLASNDDLLWNYGDSGIAKKYQDEYKSFRKFSGKSDVKEIIETYLSAFNHEDESITCEAFVEWSKWEYARSGEKFPLSIDNINVKDSRYINQLSRVKIMAHYAENNFFMTKEGVLFDSNVLKDIPTIVVTNDKDPLCTPDNLSILKSNLPNAEFVVQKNADFHWIFNPKFDRLGRSNDFIENAYAYGVEKIRQINAGHDVKLNIS